MLSSRMDAEPGVATGLVVVRWVTFPEVPLLPLLLPPRVVAPPVRVPLL